MVNFELCFIWDMERKSKRIVGASAFLLIGMSAAACADAQNPFSMDATDTPQTNVYEVEPNVTPTPEDFKRSDLSTQTYPTPPPAGGLTEILIEPTSEVDVNSEILNITFDSNQTIAVLEHHNPSFGISGSNYEPAYMSPEVYAAQLKYLQENGFYTPSEVELLGWLEGKHGLPQKSLIIRIDIGRPFKDYEQGFSLLEEHGFRAILFILASKIPEQSTPDLVGWDTIRDYMARGVLIPGSHGMKHPDYGEISETEARQDALDAKILIEEKLGREIYFFAYPFDSEAYEDMLLEYYKMLFGSYQNRAFAGEPLVGTRYPYIRGGFFDWEKFEYDLMSGIGGR